MATVRVGDFEWDADKSVRNVKKHGVGFVEAMQCFLDPHGVDLADARCPDRLVLIGASQTPRLLYVVYAERSDGAILRIISARRATRHEKKIYSQYP
ncbi:MAG: BrnT family toxin [Polyangiaceae bacterium]|nr:BrnT family toxin [Polyangiaceae bacterium]